MGEGCGRGFGWVGRSFGRGSGSSGAREVLVGDVRSGQGDSVVWNVNLRCEVQDWEVDQLVELWGCWVGGRVRWRRQTSSASKSLDNESFPSDHAGTLQSDSTSTVNSGWRFEAVASFRLIWWNQGSGSRKKLSIWRPIVPEGMVYFGDISVQGYEPPNTCIVLRDSGDDDLFKPPLDFQLTGQIKKHRHVENISFWLPQAPPVGNQLGTFVVRSGFKKPPRRFALKLADPDMPSGSDDTGQSSNMKYGLQKFY
ncbi:hypothetical protein CsSME_00049923 [Camellia sinensis var. sinensis]